MSSRKAIGNILVGAIFLIFIVWFLLTYSDNFNFFENLVVIAISAFIAFSIGALFFHVPEWVDFGDTILTDKERRGFNIRIWVTRVIALIGLLLVILFLYLYADGLTFWQNIAIVIIAIILVTAVNAIVWIRWGIKLGAKKDASGMFASIESRGLSSRVLGTVIIITLWLVFILWYLVFNPNEFNFFQNLGIFIVSAMISIGIIAIMWVRWGFKIGKDVDETGELEKWIPRGLGSRILGTIIVGDFGLAAVLLFIIFNPMNFSWLENLAILIISLLIIGVVIAAMWISMKKSG
jgi:hypothetical protein